jgi:co-chaperonin GroES (HSP10)
MKLLREGVLAKRKKTPGMMGRFYVPETVREQTQIAKVIHVSEGENRIKPGDLILYAKHAGIGMPEFGDEVSFFKLDEIEGIVTQESQDVEED